ncbi:MAG: NifU family protein [Polyangiaceae bacterium]|nr:NifU family protein [Polyangiaceae bacterium]
MTRDLDQVVREVLAPLLRADGGELHLVVLDGTRVHLHLSGRFAGCPGNTLAKNRVLLPALRAVDPDAELVLTSGALVPEGAEKL